MTDYVTRKTTVTTGGVKAEQFQTIGYIIYFLFGIIEIFLVFRLLLKITGANPTSNFVNFIYSLTNVITMPFTGIFRQATSPGVETTTVFEPATLIAIIVYAFLAWGITQIVMILSGQLQ